MSQDLRRAQRLSVREALPVIDAMEERVVGRLGNVSETGMLLVATAALREQALYQLQFTLSRDGRPLGLVDVGAQVLWQNTANTPGHTWAGLRFLTISEAHLALLRDWIEASSARAG